MHRVKNAPSRWLAGGAMRGLQLTRVRGVPFAGEALATWELRPAQFQSKCRRRYQEGCCRAQGQDPRPWQHPRRRQVDVFGDQSSRFSDSVLHPPQHCRCRPRSYRWLAGVQCEILRITRVRGVPRAIPSLRHSTLLGRPPIRSTVSRRVA